MTIVHFDCFSGAAGDMLLGALLDAGVPEPVVRTALDALDLAGWKLEVTEVRRASLRATRAEVTVAEGGDRRRYRDIVELLERADLSDGVRARASETFRLLGQAEARVHGISLDDVHLHEAGALDALIDVVGVAAALDHLGPARVSASAIATGTGTVDSAHGTLPVPAPAVVELLRGIPLAGRGDRELVTPTGAALLRSACDSFGEFPDMIVERAGYGAGAHDDLSTPNVVRALVGSPVADSPPASGAVLVETNLDDLNPEIVPYVVGALLDAGALDAWVTPVVMKKGRAGHVLSVLTDEARRAALTEILFRETSTLGVRHRQVARTTLTRDLIEADVDGVIVRVKAGRLGNEVVNLSPEHDDARAASERLGIPLKVIYERAVAAARRMLEGDEPV